MSGANGRAMAWAIRVPDLSHARKLVLVAVAEHTDRNGLAWPALSTVADRLGVSARTVRRHVDALERSGLLVRVRRHRNANGTLGVWVLRVLVAVDNPADQGTPSCPVDQGTPGRESPGDQWTPRCPRGTRSNGTGSTRDALELETTNEAPAVDNDTARANARAIREAIFGLRHEVDGNGQDRP